MPVREARFVVQSGSVAYSNITGAPHDYFCHTVVLTTRSALRNSAERKRMTTETLFARVGPSRTGLSSQNARFAYSDEIGPRFRCRWTASGVSGADLIATIDEAIQSQRFAMGDTVKIWSLSLRLLIMVILLSFGVSGSAWAGNLISFDNENLIAYEQDGNFFGYYGMPVPEIASGQYFRPSFSCLFFFYSAGPVERKRGAANIRAFYTQGDYNQRDLREDLLGQLLIERASWTITLEREPAGCGSVAGGGFSKDDALPYREEKRVTAIGIFVVKQKTHLYNREGINFSPRKAYLVQGNVVVVLNRSGEYVLVKFLNPKTSETSNRWIPEVNLISPFPVL
jgi:hypothetical protein